MPQAFIPDEIPGGFLRLPHSIVEHDWGTDTSAALALIRIWNLLDKPSNRYYDNWRDLANKLGTSQSNLVNRHKPNWIKHGFARVDKSQNLYLLLPDGEAVAVQVAEPVDKGIAEEIADQPKRESTGLNQKDRWKLIKDAWNKHKPVGYMQLDGSVNLPLLIAIETQTKRLKVDRDDYDGFIGAVLRGAKADAWWAEKDFKATAVFGFGANLDDRKFENVEKLYRAGLKITPRQAPKDFDDETALQLIREAWPKAPYKRVARRHFTTQQQALDAAAGPGILIGIKKGYCSEEDDITCRQMERIKVLGMNPSADPEWYDEEVLGLTYVEGNSYPSYWTDPSPLPLN